MPCPVVGRALALALLGSFLAAALPAPRAGEWEPLPEPDEREEDGDAPAPAEPREEKPLLVVYPFACEDAAFGAKVAKVFRGKLLRDGKLCALAEIEEEERLARAPTAFGAGSDPYEVAAHARSTFAAGVAVCGSAERRGDAFRLRLAALDLRGAEPVRLLEREFEGENVHWVVQAAKEVAAALAGEPPPPVNRPAPKIASLGPEMLSNGSFERTDAGPAAGWTELKPGIALAEREGGGRCLRYELTKGVAVTTGLFCYSEEIEIEKGASYQVSFDVRTAGPSVILFVKGYAQLPDEKTGRPGPRMVYNYQKRHYPEKPGAWERLETHAFTPGHPEHPPTRLRVMLYAYLRPGRVEFDDVSVRKATLAKEE